MLLMKHWPLAKDICGQYHHDGNQKINIKIKIKIKNKTPLTKFSSPPQGQAENVWDSSCHTAVPTCVSRR